MTLTEMLASAKTRSGSKFGITGLQKDLAGNQIISIKGWVEMDTHTPAGVKKEKTDMHWNLQGGAMVHGAGYDLIQEVSLTEYKKEEEEALKKSAKAETEPQ